MLKPVLRDGRSLSRQVTFFMSIGQPYTVTCAASGDATCLQLGRVDFEALAANYPEQQARRHPLLRPLLLRSLRRSARRAQ